MAIRGPRLEFAVGAFLLLALGSLLVLAFATTNRQFGGGGTYDLTAKFTNLGGLRPQAPVKIGGVVIGKVSSITLDPVRFNSIVTLSIDDTYSELPADTSAGIYTAGLLGENFIGLAPGGDPEFLKPGEEIAYTQPAVDLIQLVGKYMFGGGGDAKAAPPADGAAADPAAAAGATPPVATPQGSATPGSDTPGSATPTSDTPKGDTP